MRLSPGCKCCYPPCPTNRIACVDGTRFRSLTATLSGVLGSAKTEAKCDAILEGAYTLAFSSSTCVWSSWISLDTNWTTVGIGAVKLVIHLSVEVAGPHVAARLDVGHLFGTFASSADATTVKWPWGGTSIFQGILAGYSHTIPPLWLASVDLADPVTCADMEAGQTLTYDSGIDADTGCDVSGIQLLVELDP